MGDRPPADEWIPVPGYDLRYWVRGDATVWSTMQEGRPLTPGLRGRYLALSLAEPSGGVTAWRLHVLMLTTYDGPAPDGHEGCHDDDDPLNNHIDNLRWDTRSANALDMTRNGRNHLANRTRCPRDHLLEEPNLIPFQLAIGRRSCASCERARKWLSRHPADTRSLRELADQYYARLVGVTLSR